MRNVAAMLYCPNPTCQASNSADQNFCQNCSTPLPHRYLWALGEQAADYQPGTLVADRYLYQQPRLFLDTKPGLLSNTYYELPEPLQPYLRLTAFQLHVPQVYDWIAASSKLVESDLVLLEAPIVAQTQVGSGHSAAEQDTPAVQILPSIAAQWQQASCLRQLNWLWQIATLWQPLSSENAVATLLNPELVRVEGAIIRILELQIQINQPNLADLGQFWLLWAKTARSEISGFLSQLCQSLINGEVHNAELLLGYLDAAIAQLSSAQVHQIQIATLSDQGPTRQRNEDACYPASGASSKPINPALLIVCDGIGGHQGGDVASNLAIATLEQRIKQLDLLQLDSVTLQIELEKAVCAANDEISQRNDSEHRFDRQRMGTTVVMALTRSHELYITHVGDSRAYWITRHGCHQITLDDDVASREVRLGYSFYRQALHQPSAGSLVQALGMGASTMLYPTVQRFIPDEEGVFLLCSDGLSDNDRVEEVWQSDILPLLDGKVDLATVCRQLVEVGNTRNGYDNVTIGLVLYRISTTGSLPTLTELPVLPAFTATQPTALPTRVAATELVAPATALATGQQADTTADVTTEIVTPASRKGALLPLLIGIGILIGIGWLVMGLLMPNFRAIRQTDEPDISSSPAPSTSTEPSVSLATAPLEIGSFIQLSRLPQVDSADKIGAINDGSAGDAGNTSRIESTGNTGDRNNIGNTNDTDNTNNIGNADNTGNTENTDNTGSTDNTGNINNAGDSSATNSDDADSTNSPDNRMKLPTLVTRPNSLPVSPAPASPLASSPPPITPTTIGEIPIGTVLEVLSKQTPSQQESWVELRVCSITAGNSPESPTVSPTASVAPTAEPSLQIGEIGWIREADLLPLVTPKTDLTPEQQQACS